MEHLDSFIVDLALILVAAGIVTILFKKIKQPVVLGYIVAGFLISPNFIWLPTVTDGANISTWADIGIIFLMFGLGLEFSFHKIAKVGGSAIITAVVVMGAMIGIGYTVGLLIGWDPLDSIFLGCMISMSSTMIILKAYEELKLKNEKFAQLTMGVLVIEDIVGIFMMIVLTAISVGKESLSGAELAFDIGKLLMILVIILCVGIYVVPTLLKKVERFLTDEILMIASLAFCFLMVVISTEAGFSEALGAFLAGSILAGTVKGEKIEHLVNPLKDLFGAVFFISVGMLIEPAMLIKYIVPILIITVVTIIGQMTFSCIGALASGQPLKTAVRLGFSMVQVGEFSFILASLGTSLGVTGDFLYPIVVCVSVITTFTTPIFIKRGEWAYEKIYKLIPNKLRRFFMNYTSESKSEEEKDNDWSEYLKKYFIKLITGTALLIGIYFVGTSYLHPYVLKWIENPLVAGGIVLVILLAVMAPVISMICRKKSILFNKLWLKSKANILPLITLRAIAIMISFVFVVLTVEKLFISLHILIIAAIAIAIILFSIRSDFVKGYSAKLQARFLANFNQKILSNAAAMRKGEKPVWVDEALYVAKIKLTKIYKRKQIKDFVASRVYGVMFISIRHPDGTYTHIPKADDKVHEDDILYAMGTKEQIEAYILHACKADYLEIEDEKLITLKEYLGMQNAQNIPIKDRIFYAAIPVSKSGEFARKRISESGFVQKYYGIIIGVERELLPIISPKSDFLFAEGDILWAIGPKDMTDALICSGLLEEKKLP